MGSLRLLSVLWLGVQILWCLEFVGFGVHVYGLGFDDFVVQLAGKLLTSQPRCYDFCFHALPSNLSKCQAGYASTRLRVAVGLWLHSRNARYANRLR